MLKTWGCEPAVVALVCSTWWLRLFQANWRRRHQLESHYYGDSYPQTRFQANHWCFLLWINRDSWTFCNVHGITGHINILLDAIAKSSTVKFKEPLRVAWICSTHCAGHWRDITSDELAYIVNAVLHGLVLISNTRSARPTCSTSPRYYAWCSSLLASVRLQDSDWLQCVINQLTLTFAPYK